MDTHPQSRPDNTNRPPRRSGGFSPRRFARPAGPASSAPHRRPYQGGSSATPASVGGRFAYRPEGSSGASTAPSGTPHHTSRPATGSRHNTFSGNRGGTSGRERSGFHGGGGARAPRGPRMGVRGGAGPSPLKAASGATRTIRRRPDGEQLIESGNGEAVRFVALGGLEEVGRNMMFFEYKDEIVIIDAGLGFADEETPGVDYIIPNTEYLEKKKQNIRGILVTHGHLDHIGALPFIIEKLGNPIIYATTLTKALIEKRHEEFPNLPKLRFGIVKNRDVVRLGEYFTAEFFGVAHNIPDTTGISLRTPVGNIVHFADFKIDYDANEQPQGLEEFAEIGRQGIHTLMLDSTSAMKPGRSLSEKVVEKNLEELLMKAEGRVIIATFSSMISRIAELVKIAEKHGRRIFLNGYSMKGNIQIAQNLGIIKSQQGTILPMEELPKYKDEKILIITTGGQGEVNAGLAKMVSGEHRVVTIKTGDVVVFSASVIPGNERDLQVLQDNLCRQGAIVYKSSVMDIHSSGHAPKDDLKMVIELMKPKYFLPVHGYYFMRAANTQIAWEAGVPKSNTILSDNGLVTELSNEGVRLTKEIIETSFVMVDGLGVGDVEEVVLRDRKNLAEEGMLIAIATISRSTGRPLKNPDIISRGFIHLKNNQEFVEDLRVKTHAIMEKLTGTKEPEPDYVKTMLREQLGQYIFGKTQRRPMIIPVIIEI